MNQFFFLFFFPAFVLQENSGLLPKKEKKNSASSPGPAVTVAAVRTRAMMFRAARALVAESWRAQHSSSCLAATLLSSREFHGAGNPSPANLSSAVSCCCPFCPQKFLPSSFAAFRWNRDGADCTGGCSLLQQASSGEVGFDDLNYHWGNNIYISSIFEAQRQPYHLSWSWVRQLAFSITTSFLLLPRN